MALSKSRKRQLQSVLVTFLQGTGQNGNYFRIPEEKFSNLQQLYPDRTFPLSNLINTTFNLIVLGKCRTIIINSIELFFYRTMKICNLIVSLSS